MACGEYCPVSILLAAACQGCRFPKGCDIGNPTNHRGLHIADGEADRAVQDL